MKPLGTMKNRTSVPPSTAKNAPIVSRRRQDELERAVVPAEQPLEPRLRRLGEPASGVALRPAQKAAAQHGRERHGHDARDQNGDTNRDRELSEQATEHAGNEQHRNE